jgi:hypothetical protein
MYGCTTQAFLWESRPGSNRLLRFVFPTSDINPYMPRAPGGGGLLLSCRDEITRDHWSLFIRIQMSPKAKWLYAGEYDSEIVGSLEGEAFRRQNKKVFIFKFVFFPILIFDLSYVGQRELGQEDLEIQKVACLHPEESVY